MAAVSDLLPSPGAPETVGTRAVTGPFPIDAARGLVRCRRRCRCHVRLRSRTRSLRRGGRRVVLLTSDSRRSGGRRSGGWSGSDSRTGTWQPGDKRPGSLGGDRLRNRRSDRRPWIARRIAGHHFLAREAVHTLARGIADVEHVGDLRPILFLGGKDVGAQVKISALVLAGGHRDALRAERGGELLMELLAQCVRGPDDRIQRDLGDRFNGRLGRSSRLLRGIVCGLKQRTATARKAKPCEANDDGPRHRQTMAPRRSSVRGRHSDPPILEVQLNPGCRRTYPAAGDSYDRYPSRLPIP